MECGPDQLFQSQGLHLGRNVRLSRQQYRDWWCALWSHCLWRYSKVSKHIYEYTTLLDCFSRIFTPCYCCPGCRLLWQITVHFRTWCELLGTSPTRADPGGLARPSSFSSTPCSALPSVEILPQRYISSACYVWSCVNFLECLVHLPNIIIIIEVTSHSKLWQKFDNLTKLSRNGWIDKVTDICYFFVKKKCLLVF